MRNYCKLIAFLRNPRTKQNEMKREIIAACVIALAYTQPSVAQDAITEKKIDSLISLMTLDEKLGQMQQLNVSRKHGNMEERVRSGTVGSILNAGNKEKIIKFQDIATKESRLKIPLIIGRDVIHGYATVFPIPLGQAASWNAQLVQKAASISATEAASDGINWTFAPMMDIARDARWGRIAESFGEDPILTAVLATAMVKGFQEKNFAACAKHFVGYGAAEGGRDYNTTFIAESELRNTYLVPFRASQEAGVLTMMSAFNNLNGLPVSANKHLIGGILKDEWQFNGFVVSDWNTHGEMIIHGLCANEYEAAEKGINAGVDMEMVSTSYFFNAKKLLDAKKITGQQINESVRRILRVKYQLGLFDNPYQIPTTSPLLSGEHLAVAKELAAQSIVLLKNENKTLPLQKPKTVAVIGYLAHSKVDQNGCWSLDADTSAVVTPLAALREALKGNATILYSKGVVNCISEDSTLVPEAIEVAKMADVVVFFCGEDERMSGEAHSRAILDLPGAQLQLLRHLEKTGKPVVTVIMAGRPLTIEEVSLKSDALLFAWHPGTMGGAAIADVLLGKTNPSGKLPVSFPRRVGQIPIHYNHFNTGRPADPSENIDYNTGTPLDPRRFTSKYIDLPITPLYPFGFGLSYTSFDLGDISLSANQITAEGSLAATVTVTNTGSMAGYEVVQLYVRDRVASLIRPVKELKAFEKVYLLPGEKKSVTFTIPCKDLGFYDYDNHFVIEPGDFDLWVGNNASTGKHTEFTIAKPTK